MYYAGLENGLYVSWDGGAHWYLLGLGLPNASVYDLALDTQQNSLVVATHGRSVWILDDLTPLQEFTPAMATETAHLFAAPEAVRFWQWSQVEALGDGAFYGKNPPVGATLSYFVAHDEKEPGELVITDAQGHEVRTLKGTHTLEEGGKLRPMRKTCRRQPGHRRRARPSSRRPSLRMLQHPRRRSSSRSRSPLPAQA